MSIFFFFSTGVGRAGVFIAIVAQMDRGEREGIIDVYNYVQYMRKQRPSMVLNEVKLVEYNHDKKLRHCNLYTYQTTNLLQVEYIFIHDTLYEAIQNGMIEGTLANDYEI